MKKVITIIAITLFALLNPGLVSGQSAGVATAPTKYVKKGFLHFDFNGLSLGDKVTEKQIIEMFGKPLSVYKSYEESLDGIFTNYEHMVYEKLIIDIDDVYGLCLFTSTDPKYAACTKDISGGVKIGDSVEKLKAMDVYYWEELKISDEYTKKTGGRWFKFEKRNYRTDEGVAAVLVKDGIIVGFEGIL